MAPKIPDTAHQDAQAEAEFTAAVDHQQSGRLADAEVAYKRILSQYPDHVLTMSYLADVAFQAGNHGQAIDLFTRILAIDPDDADAHIDLGRVFQEQGRFQDALDCYDRGLARKPHSTRAIALKGEVLLAAGRRQELAYLVDFDRLLQSETVEVPGGYESLEDFNAALVNFSVNHPSLAAPPDKATTNGRQTGNLNDAGGGHPIRHLMDIIQQSAMLYYEHRPPDPGHPFLSQDPGPRTINIWATVLEREGHQKTHIHPEAWLSGVYYAKVPDVVRRDDPERTGWIEFGWLRTYPTFLSDLPTRHYLPCEGVMFLFPSYFWHRTVPLKSDDVRVSIAFDLVSPSAKE